MTFKNFWIPVKNLRDSHKHLLITRNTLARTSSLHTESDTLGIPNTKQHSEFAFQYQHYKGVLISP